jgi:sugar/nucleoside kinase (ribokinase family)
MLRAALEREGVALALVPTTATGTVVVLTDGSGERTMLSQRVPFAADALLPPGAEWIVVSGYALLERAGPRLAAQLGAAPARRVLLGCAVPDGGEAQWRDAARHLDAHLAILNRAEAAALGPSAPDRPEPLALAAATALRCSVVVTAAHAAAAVIDGGAPVMVRGAAGAPPVDTTGAGDAFAASLLARLADLPWPPSRDACEVALAAAMSHAAAVTLVTGAQAHVPGEGPVPAARVS